MDITSVVIYLSVFLSSFFFLWIADILIFSGERERETQNFIFVRFHLREYKGTHSLLRFSINSATLCGSLFALMGLLIPSLLAAVRSVEVGLDNFYVVPNFRLALSSPSFAYFNHQQEELEYFFALLLYFCAKCANLNLFYFVIQFIPLSCIYAEVCHADSTRIIS